MRLFGFLILWGALFAGGEWQSGGVRYGLPVFLAVLALAAAWEIGALRTPPRQALTDLGLGRPTLRSMAAAGTATAILVLFYFLYSIFVSPLNLAEGWPGLLIGLFAYHGLAEELAWRGYAFRRIREGCSFHAAVWKTIPLIAATHFPILITSGVPVGTAAILVAAATCFPLAWLWELGGRTIWAPALLHASIDLFKLLNVPAGAESLTFSLSLAAASLTVPFIVFAFHAAPSACKRLAEPL